MEKYWFDTKFDKETFENVCYSFIFLTGYFISYVVTNNFLSSVFAFASLIPLILLLITIDIRELDSGLYQLWHSIRYKRFQKKLRKNFESYFLFKKVVLKIYKEKEITCEKCYQAVEIIRENYCNLKFIRSIDRLLYPYSFLLTKISEILEQKTHGNLNLEEDLLEEINNSFKLILEDIENTKNIEVQKEQALKEEFSKILTKDLHEELNLMAEIKQKYQRKE